MTELLHSQKRTCEACGATHAGVYGSGRYCGPPCAKTIGARKKWAVARAARTSTASKQTEQLVNAHSNDITTNINSSGSQKDSNITINTNSDNPGIDVGQSSKNGGSGGSGSNGKPLVHLSNNRKFPDSQSHIVTVPRDMEDSHLVSISLNGEQEHQQSCPPISDADIHMPTPQDDHHLSNSLGHRHACLSPSQKLSKLSAVCESCRAPHDESYGSGRFCSVHCARRVAAASKWAKQRGEKARRLEAIKPTMLSTPLMPLAAPSMASAPAPGAPGAATTTTTTIATTTAAAAAAEAGKRRRTAPQSRMTIPLAPSPQPQPRIIAATPLPRFPSPAYVDFVHPAASPVVPVQHHQPTTSQYPLYAAHAPAIPSAVNTAGPSTFSTCSMQFHVPMAHPIPQSHLCVYANPSVSTLSGVPQHPHSYGPAPGTHHSQLSPPIFFSSYHLQQQQQQQPQQPQHTHHYHHHHHHNHREIQVPPNILTASRPSHIVFSDGNHATAMPHAAVKDCDNQEHPHDGAEDRRSQRMEHDWYAKESEQNTAPAVTTFSSDVAEHGSVAKPAVDAARRNITNSSEAACLHETKVRPSSTSPESILKPKSACNSDHKNSNPVCTPSSTASGTRQRTKHLKSLGSSSLILATSCKAKSPPILTKAKAFTPIIAPGSASRRKASLSPLPNNARGPSSSFSSISDSKLLPKRSETDFSTSSSKCTDHTGVALAEKSKATESLGPHDCSTAAEALLNLHQN